MGKQMAANAVNPPKVTPIQVAFIVDRYLSDHHFTKTLSVFRSEASKLLSKTKSKQAPKNLLSLSAILEEYISLKEQKVMVDQEKRRVEVLLQGIQEVMKAYNSAVPPPHSNASPPASQKEPVKQNELPKSGSPLPAIGYHTYNPPIANPMPALHSPNPLNPTSISTPSIDILSKNKRKASQHPSDATPTTKRIGAQSPRSSDQLNGTTEASQLNVPTAENPRLHTSASKVKSFPRSSVANLSSKHSPPSQSDSSGPHTPPQSLPSQTDKAISPADNLSLLNSSTGNNSYMTTPIGCQIISSRTVVVSPFKHTSHYAKDVTFRISPSCKPSPKRTIKRDHVKGRLDFKDLSDPMCLKKTVNSESANSANADSVDDFFDMDIPNFDVFGSDFSLTDLLLDIDLDTEGICPQSLHNFDPSASSPGAPLDIEHRRDHNLSTVTTVLSEKNMSIQGPEFVASKSITKSIKVVSPVKNQTNSMAGLEN